MRDIPPDGRPDVVPARSSRGDLRARRRAQRRRVRAALAVAMLAVAATLLAVMSESAPRLAGTDHTGLKGFVARVDAGRELCQAHMLLPAHARKLRLLISTRGRGRAGFAARFSAPRARRLAGGRLSGARNGWVFIPLAPQLAAPVAGTLCIRNAGRVRVLLAGEPAVRGADTARVGGRRLPARVDVAYFRPGSETWWQLLPTLTERFGYGKSSLFGSWTLGLLALALLGVWIATARLLTRELT